MQKLLLLLTLLPVAFPGRMAAETNRPTTISTTAATGTITVKITNLKNQYGMLGVSLYNSENGFPADHTKACASATKSIDGTTDEVIFSNLPYGTYAISVLHDENNNGKLDTTFLIGIPKEGIGVSNNPKARRGPPDFNECVFTLDSSDHELSIAMRYF